MYIFRFLVELHTWQIPLVTLFFLMKRSGTVHYDLQGMSVYLSKFAVDFAKYFTICLFNLTPYFSLEIVLPSFKRLC